MHAFNYRRATSVEDAAAAFQGAEDGAYISGGHTLLPTMKQRLAAPSDLIDLAGIAALAGIAVDGEAVEIGALTPHAAVAASADVQGAIPALAVLAGKIGDPQVRNKGTIGGSIANNDPAADYPAALLGLGASVVTDRRTIAAGRLLHRPVRDGARERRNHHGGALPPAQEGRLCEVPESGVALCHRGRHGGGDGRRRAHRRDRRRTLRVPRDRHGRCTRRRAGPRGDAAGTLPRRPQFRHPRERRVPRASGGRHGSARDGRRLLTRNSRPGCGRRRKAKLQNEANFA